MIALRKSGLSVEQGGVFLRKNGVLVEQEVYLRKNGVLTLIHSPGGALSLEYPGEAYGAAASVVGVIVTTTSITVTVTGGRAPYTPLWTKVGGADPDWVITAPNQLTTAFRRYSVPPATTYTENFICTVTDSSGQSIATAEIPVTVTNYGGLEVPI